MEAERNGVTLADVLEALDNNDAGKGRRLLRQWMSDEPRPCPCCGGKTVIIERGDNVIIMCDECGMSSPTGEMKDVVEIWNRRC